MIDKKRKFTQLARWMSVRMFFDSIQITLAFAAAIFLPFLISIWLESLLPLLLLPLTVKRAWCFATRDKSGVRVKCPVCGGDLRIEWEEMGCTEAAYLVCTRCGVKEFTGVTKTESSD